LAAAGAGPDSARSFEPSRLPIVRRVAASALLTPPTPLLPKGLRY